MVDFFIDTADLNAITNIWNKIKDNVDSDKLLGITTNPNAFKKINMFRLKEWSDHLPKLCELVTNIRGDRNGVVYVQAPVSSMSSKEIIDFADYISNFSDGNTRLGLKIPPFLHALDVISDIEDFMETNVTGVADVGTALFANSFFPKYVSIIPGRMEEVGIDAKSQVRYLMNSRLNSYIITGSMRTLEGLRWVSEMGTVPTIGERVWDLIDDLTFLDKLSFDITSLEFPVQHFSPAISDKNTELSIAFFKQMDEYGQKCKEDFLK